MSEIILPLNRFEQMNLTPEVAFATRKAGYETPTSIQEQTIPLLMAGKDMIGQARTGTGKTAAFALPLLSRIDLKNKRPQVLVLTPTRELAIQVAASFKTYGAGLKGLNVLSVYGGQSFAIQLAQLKRGVHVVVGTPGRLMDHMRRKTLSFTDLFCVVIDEADEMLHMGFIDDVEWILEHAPENTQTALFSATMPPPIRKIAQKYLSQPEQISVTPEDRELGSIHQKFFLIKGIKKDQALVRILEATSFDGVIVFVKTKSATLDVAKALENKGMKAEALNGDLAQNARERTINRLKSGHIDILVATDVAARGLDVDRISHVVNYDMPPRVEPYIHRIGRTGRAGRNGEAILFVNRNETWMLKKIETATRRKITQIQLPTNTDINKKRVDAFKERLTLALASSHLETFEHLIETYARENEIPLGRVAAALASMNHGSHPLLLPEEKSAPVPLSAKRTVKSASPSSKSKVKSVSPPAQTQSRVEPTPPPQGMERYRIEVGRRHGVKARNIVGAISNETGLESKFIKNVSIDQDHSFIDLPFGMPGDIFSLLQKTWVKSQKMAISKVA